jgi:hypothetical protein
VTDIERIDERPRKRNKTEKKKKREKNMFKGKKRSNTYKYPFAEKVIETNYV